MRTRIFPIFLLLLAGCGKEPQYQGKTASEWRDKLNDRDQHTRIEAIEPLVSLSHESSIARDALLTAMNDRDSSISSTAIKLAVHSEDTTIQRKLQSFISGQDPWDKMNAIDGLWQVDSAPEKNLIPAIQSLLNDKNPEVRASAIALIGRLDPPPRSLIPKLQSMAPQEPSQTRFLLSDVIDRLSSK